MRVIGYTRVSTDEQATSGLGLEAQDATLCRHVDSRDGWRLVQVVRDEGEWSGDLDRPGLMRALGLLAAGRADALMVAKLDRVSRSVVDFAHLLQWFRDAEKAFIALDIGVDTSTAAGEMVASMMMVVAQWERRTVSERTIAALAAKRARGPLGLPAVVDDQALAERIRELKRMGKTLWEICAELDADGVPTLRGGGKWRPSSLQTVLGYKRPPRKRRPAELPAVPRRKVTA